MHKQVYKCPNHTANLNNMRLNNEWCDLIIKVDGKEFHAHKNILAANLQYFKTMLSGDSFRESKEGVVTMDFINATDLEAFICYAYTGEISLTDNNALSLLETANYLGEDGIKRACIQFLEKHLKPKDSFRAYSFANSIECLSLKSTAKSSVLLNFGRSSQTSEYLDLDFESLSDFLSDGKAQLVKSQQTLFEGIMRWITHDAYDRRFHINDLLSFVDATKLSTDYLMKYLGSIANREDDDLATAVNNVISWYYTCSKSQRDRTIVEHQIEPSQKILTILGTINGKSAFQSYNFLKKRWSQRQEIQGTRIIIWSSWAVLNDKFYFTSGEPGSYNLSMFNASTNLLTVMNSSSSILPGAAVCACSRFLYLCSGIRSDESYSDQVLRYDPQTSSFETLPPTRTRRQRAAAIFYRGSLHVLGGFDGPCLNKVERYDADAKKWMELPSMCEPRSSHAAAVLDGKLYACGGWKNNSVEVYDPAKNSWQVVASMNRKRWDFTLVAYGGKLLAIGGEGEESVEVYDSSKDHWQMDDEMSSGLQMEWNFGGLISSNSITDAH